MCSRGHAISDIYLKLASRKLACCAKCLGYKAEGTLLILEGSVPRFSPPQHQLFREPRALLFQSTPHTHRKSSRPIFGSLLISLLRVRLTQIEALAFMWEAFTPSSSRKQPLLRARIRPLNLNKTPGSRFPPTIPFDYSILQLHRAWHLLRYFAVSVFASTLLRKVNIAENRNITTRSTTLSPSRFKRQLLLGHTIVAL